MSGISGRLIDATSDEPLPGFRVVLDEESAPPVVTDGRGSFTLKDVRPGVHRIRVSGPGFGEQSQCLMIPSGQEIDLVVALHPRPIPLEPLEVSVKGARPLWLVRAGFYRRMRAGGGIFITEEDIEEKAPSRLSEMFRGEASVSVVDGNPQPMQSLQSVHPVPGVPGRRCPLETPGACRRPQDTGTCPIQFLVDGQRVPLILGVDTFHPADVAAIEAYFHASEIPPQFNVGRAACGVVNIWLKVHPGRPG
ncbi:MAG TPA: carboxypeptidase regulatory-like domain-containing protein [Gemmatimonadota bacterium]|nr:carboxypeptidase regulatory-like domain-containing protein [Gemmatimonadota bacterium]